MTICYDCGKIEKTTDGRSCGCLEPVTDALYHRIFFKIKFYLRHLKYRTKILYLRWSIKLQEMKL